MTSAERGGGHRAVRSYCSETSPFEDFLADVVDLALSVDRQLAGILNGGGVLPATPRLPWKGNRRQGLELCLSMLRYAREEPVGEELGRRLDEGIIHVVAKLVSLSRLHGPLN